MSTIGSSLSKGQDGTGLINPSALGQLAGVPKDMSRAAFDAAVTQERANIANNGTGVWSAGEKISIFGEVGTRIWFVGASASLSHARNVTYQGQVYALAGDANVFGPTTGAPASGTGANGDYLADATAGLVYGPKASGAWPAGVMALAVAGKAVADLTVKTDSVGTDLLVINRSGVDYATPVSALETTIHALDAITPVQADELPFYDVSGSATGKMTIAQLASLVASINGTSSGGSTTPTPTPTSTPTPTPTPTALTMTSPTYTDRGDGSGKQMLTGGTATGTVPNFPTGTFTITVMAKYTGSQPTQSLPFLTVSNSTGEFYKLINAGTALVIAVPSFTDGGGPNPNPSDTAAHTLSLVTFSGYGQAFADGNRTSQNGPGNDTAFGTHTPVIITVDASKAPGGLYSMKIWDGASAGGGGNLIETLEFNGSGAFS